MGSPVPVVDGAKLAGIITSLCAGATHRSRRVADIMMSREPLGGSAKEGTSILNDTRLAARTRIEKDGCGLTMGSLRVW